MKKILKLGGLGFVGLTVLIALIAILGGGSNKSFQEGIDAGRQRAATEQSSDEITATEKEEEARYAILSSKDKESGDTVSEISIWEEAGSGGSDNVSIGNVPHNTKVEVIGSREVEGRTFYHIRSSVGKVSTLPTSWNARVKAQEERPESEWFVEADKSFPVEGWVMDSFVTNNE